MKPLQLLVCIDEVDHVVMRRSTTCDTVASRRKYSLAKQPYWQAVYHPQVLLPNTTRSVLMIHTLNLPRTTRSKLVPLLAGKCSFQEQHERRWGALYASMMQSENILVQYMARRAVYNVPGTLGTNWVILRHKFGVPRKTYVFKLCIM